MAAVTSTGLPPTLAPKTPKRRSTDLPLTYGRRGLGRIIANVVGILFTVIMIFPAYWVVNTAFKPPNEVLSFTPAFVPKNPTFDNFKSAVNAPNFLLDLRNSVVITISAVACALVVGFLAALAIARFRFYGRRSLIMIVLIVQMIPFIALLIPLYLTLNAVELTNTLPGVTIVYLVFVLPYTVWTLRGFISNVPKELDEAAMVDGCTRMQTFYRIILPLVGPGLVATSIFGFIQAWNEFIIINTLNSPEKQNLMAWLLQNQTLRGTNYGPLMAGAVITSLPVVVFFLMIQKHIAVGLTAGAVKG